MIIDSGSLRTAVQGYDQGRGFGQISRHISEQPQVARVTPETPYFAEVSCPAGGSSFAALGSRCELPVESAPQTGKVGESFFQALHVGDPFLRTRGGDSWTSTAAALCNATFRAAVQHIMLT